jgi:hypothetical protein
MVTIHPGANWPGGWCRITKYSCGS